MSLLAGKGRFALRMTGLMLLLLSVAAQAIIVRHDRRDSGYQSLPGQYPQVFWLNENAGHKRCIATLVGAEWALTAAHCLQETPLGASLAAGTPWPVQVDRENNHIDQAIVHPGFDVLTSRQAQGVDMALLHLRTPVALPAIPLYGELETPSEQGQLLTLMGWGFTGTGESGRSHDDGRFRVATNQVSHAADWLEILFDDPRLPGAKVPELEGMPSLGDSGGPAFIDTEGGVALAGVARGELADGRHPEQGQYGSVAVYERVSLHLDWLRQVMGEDEQRSAVPRVSVRAGE